MTDIVLVVTHLVKAAALISCFYVSEYY